MEKGNILMNTPEHVFHASLKNNIKEQLEAFDHGHKVGYKKGFWDGVMTLGVVVAVIAIVIYFIIN